MDLNRELELAKPTTAPVKMKKRSNVMLTIVMMTMTAKQAGLIGQNGELVLQLAEKVFIRAQDGQILKNTKDIENGEENAQTSIQHVLANRTSAKNAKLGNVKLMVDTVTTPIKTMRHVLGQTFLSPIAKVVIAQCVSPALAFKSSSTNTILTSASGRKQLD